jgi:hypothetical protein
MTAKVKHDNVFFISNSLTKLFSSFTRIDFGQPDAEAIPTRSTA